jgi:hypothetical protein
MEGALGRTMLLLEVQTHREILPQHQMNTTTSSYPDIATLSLPQLSVLTIQHNLTVPLRPKPVPVPVHIPAYNSSTKA